MDYLKKILYNFSRLNVIPQKTKFNIEYQQYLQYSTVQYLQYRVPTKVVIDSLTDWLSDPLVKISLWRRHAQTVKNSASSHNTNYIDI